MNNKQKLTHDFIKFVMENYGIRLTMTESDGEKFEELFPDLVAVLEKGNNETANNCAKRSPHESRQTRGTSKSREYSVFN